MYIYIYIFIYLLFTDIESESTQHPSGTSNPETYWSSQGHASSSDVRVQLEHQPSPARVTKLMKHIAAVRLHPPWSSSWGFSAGRCHIDLPAVWRLPEHRNAAAALKHAMSITWPSTHHVVQSQVQGPRSHTSPWETLDSTQELGHWLDQPHPTHWRRHAACHPSTQPWSCRGERRTPRHPAKCIIRTQFAKFPEQQHVLDHGTLHIHGLRLRHILGSPVHVHVSIRYDHCIQKTRTRRWDQRNCQDHAATQSRNAMMKMQKPSGAEEWPHNVTSHHAFQLCKGRVEHLYPLKMLMPPLNIAPMHL